MSSRRIKVMLVHNALMWYTAPLFRELNSLYDMELVFTHVSLRRDVYGVATSGFEALEGLKYRVRRRYLRGISPTGVPLGLLKDLFCGCYDIVVATSSSVEMILCFLAAKIRGKAFILRSEEWGWPGKSGGNRLVLPLANYIISHADAMLVPGTRHREYFISRGAPPERVFIMPNAENFTVKEGDAAESGELKRKLGIGGRVVLCVGRLVRQKGIDYLIEAFAMLRKEMADVSLLLVGEGDYRDTLEGQVRSQGLEGCVRFTGYVPNEAVVPYYLLSDVCVMPSITCGQADAWGFVINEAMSAAKPVIATDAVGAAFDMIRDGENGFIVPEQDAAALYEALKKVLAEPGTARRMGQNSASVIARGYTYDRMLEGFSRAVDSVKGKA